MGMGRDRVNHKCEEGRDDQQEEAHVSGTVAAATQRALCGALVGEGGEHDADGHGGGGSGDDGR